MRLFFATLVAISLAAEGGENGAALANCRLDAAIDPSGRLERMSERAWRWHAQAGDRVACTSAGTEPLDLEAEPLLDGADAATLRVEPQPARPIRLLRPTSEDLTVEWRRPEEGASTLVARRKVVASQLELPVARQERLLRVLRVDASPVTFVVPLDAPERVELTLPSPRPGGELFARTPGRAVEPESYLVVGAAGEMRMRPNEMGYLSMTGLSAGGYRLIPMYRGGLAAPGIDFEVQQGETTEVLPISLPQVGGLQVTIAAQELCPPPQSDRPLLLELIRIEYSQEGHSQQNHRVGEWSVDADCMVQIDGLIPGQYRATLSAAGKENGIPHGLARAEVPPDGVAEVLLRQSEVRVEGRVLLQDGNSPSSAVVTFDQDGRSVRVETGAAGDYSIDLPVPGAWVVNVSGTRYTPALHLERRFDPGVHHLDIEIPGGMLVLRVDRADGAAIEEAVQLQFTKGSRWGGVLVPDDLPTATILGVELGEYEVIATTASGWGTRRPVAFEIRDEDPYATVDLLLERVAARLVLLDPSGARVGGAMVRVDDMAGYSEDSSEPGSFVLPGVAEGRRLVVEPPAGWSPQCVISRPGGEQRVTLEPGPHSLLVVLRDGSSSLRGSLSGLPGSDCPIGLHHFAPVTALVEGSSGIELHGLPAGQFVLETAGGASIPLTVPGPPVVIGRTDG